MESNYVIWAHKPVRGQCELSGMKGYPEDWKLIYGQSVADVFPAGVLFSMDPDNPTNTALSDSLGNIDRQIVASRRLLGLIESLQIPALEFLPISILNHKNRLIPEPYTIIHPIQPIDCLVVDACVPVWSVVNSSRIDRVKHLIIDESKIDPLRLIFRPKFYFKVILIHRKLAAQIDAAGFTGSRWIELSEWPED